MESSPGAPMSRRKEKRLKGLAINEVRRLDYLSNEDFFADPCFSSESTTRPFRHAVMEAVDWSIVPRDSHAPRAFTLPDHLRLVGAKRGVLDPAKLPPDISLRDDGSESVVVDGLFTLRRVIDEYLFAVPLEERLGYFPLLTRLDQWRVHEERIPDLPDRGRLSENLYRELELYGIRARSRAELNRVMGQALAPLAPFLPVTPALPRFVDALWPPSLV